MHSVWFLMALKTPGGVLSTELASQENTDELMVVSGKTLISVCPS